MVDAHDLSACLFVRGLSNLKSQLTKAEAYAAATGRDEQPFLAAQLAATAAPGAMNPTPHDLHQFTLAAQVHWAAEGARLAVAQLLGTPRAPEQNDASTFAELHERLDATITYLRDIAPADLEAGLDRTIVIAHRRDSTSGSGRQFLLALAIPHFYYHVTSAYSILRNQGVPLTMGDFLGNWGTP